MFILLVFTQGVTLEKPNNERNQHDLCGCTKQACLNVFFCFLHRGVTWPDVFIC